MQKTQINKSKLGVTIIELLVVIVIMGVLASVGFSGYSRQAAVAMIRDEAMGMVAYIEMKVAETRRDRKDMSLQFNSTDGKIYAFEGLNCAGTAAGEYELKAAVNFETYAPGTVTSDGLSRLGGTALAVTTEIDYTAATNSCTNLNSGIMGISPMTTPGFVVFKSRTTDVRGMILKSGTLNDIKGFHQKVPNGTWTEI